eukprot:5404743-Pleurochrysis_carterae.AAC.1
MKAGSSSYELLLERSLELMQQSKALEDANKPPTPPPKSPLLDSFAKRKGFMPPPARPPDAPFNA